MRIRGSEWRVIVGGLAISAAASGCATGAAGEVARPEAPTAAQAMDEADGPKCTAVASKSAPLVVDLASQDRIALEVAMKDGISIVKYTCDGLEVLRDCHVAGAYRFAGVSLKEDVIRLNSRDEVRASLPISGVNLSGELQRGTTFDLALAMVGMRSALASTLSASDLTGQCDGATHFVRAATVGAFAMRRGSAGRVAAAADIFGAGAQTSSQSDKQSVVNDGSLESCRAASPDGDAPPAQCRSAIRLELLPIGAAAAPAVVTALENPCPEHYVLSGGKCTSKTDAAPYLCSPRDEAQCREQCKLGHAGSCYNLGYLLTGVEEACRGSADSCLSVRASQPGAPDYARLEEGAKAFAKACDGGEAIACFYVGAYHDSGFFGYAKDEAKASELYQTACKLGHGPTCFYLASHAREKDPASPQAFAFALRACDLGSKPGCFQAIASYFKGEGTAKNPKGAEDILVRTCDAGESKRCAELGLYHLEGHFGTKNVAEGIKYLSRACDLNRPDACRMLAMAHGGKWGGDKNPAKAKEAAGRGCAGEEASNKACVDLRKQYGF